MRLLPEPCPSGEDAEDASAEGGPPCHCVASRRSPRRPMPRAVIFCCQPRRRFCLGISVAVVAFVANVALFFVILDILLALLRRKCAGGANGQQKAMEGIADSAVRPTLFSDNLNNNDNSANIRPIGILSHPSNALFLTPPNAIPSHPSTVIHSSSSSSPSSSSPSSSSPSSSSPSSSSPPATLTRLRIGLTTNGTTVSSRSSAWSTSALSLSTTTTVPRIRITPTDRRMTTARQKLPWHTKGQGAPLTVVTALLDIGRDRWTQYGRTMSQYHQFMRNLLQLRVPMVIIVDEKSAAFVHKERARINWGQWTKVVQLSLHQLPLGLFLKRISLLMDSELAHWHSEWDPAMRTHPEASQAEYVVVVNSKPYFLAQTAADNPFGTEFFVWLDAGYGHGDRSVFPTSWEWHPTFPEGKISVIKLTPPGDLLSRYALNELYRKDTAVLSGGFLAGDRQAVTQLHREHHRMFLQLLEKGRVDDDQTFLVLLVNQSPQLFNVVNGDWFDAFKSFQQKVTQNATD